MHNSQQGIRYNRNTCTKNENFYSFFCLSPGNEFLVEMTFFYWWKIGFYCVSLAKSVVLTKQFATFKPRKLWWQLKVSNYKYTGKIVWENKSRYIPCIIIIYHYYHRITLLLFFTYQMPQERFFQYNQMLHTFFWFISTFRESIPLQTSCHLVILRKCYKLGG